MPSHLLLTRTFGVCGVTLAATLWLAGAAAWAVPVANPVATFSGLDKITARVTNFDVYLNETVQFGSLQITPRVCYTEPVTETQRTSVFVEVDQVSLAGGSKRIFAGWMFADSPALNAIDDAVYDFWLVDCKQSSSVPPPDGQGAATAPVAATPAAVTKPVVAAPAGRGAAAATKPVTSKPLSTLLSPNLSAETNPDAQ
jgi:hypothetical protein